MTGFGRSFIANMAQLVEHRLGKAEVEGSNPSVSTKTLDIAIPLCIMVVMKTPIQQLAYDSELSRLIDEEKALVARLGKAIDKTQEYDDILRMLRKNHQDVIALAKTK
jgi:hypothetical protein